MSALFVPIDTAVIGWHQDRPFSIAFNDRYYAAGDGVDYSQRAFISANDLMNRWLALPLDQPSCFNVAEMGFGTGLNFLTTCQLWEQYAPKSSCLHFISCEKHPLTLSDLRKVLSYWPELASQAQQLINQYPILTPGYHQLSFCNDRVKLTLMLGDAFNCFEQLLICGDRILEANLRSSFIDAWYLDGFTPSKNPDMWSDSLLNVIALLSKEGTTLAASTDASTVRASLSAFGFNVAARKEQAFISARFSKLPVSKLKQRHTPWHAAAPVKLQDKSAVIIGAGLAGCFTAHALAKRGWKVTLIEEKSAVGCGASANQQAVLFPKLSAHCSPLTQFMLMAFIHATRVYSVFLKQYNLGELKGSLLLPHNEKERLAQQGLTSWLCRYPELGCLVDAERASTLTGLKLEQTGLYIPSSGWINSPDLCRILALGEGISVHTNTHVDSLVFADNCWLVNELEAHVVVLANGHQLSQFNQTQNIPITAIRGQMTSIPTTPESVALKIPLCGEGHVLPALNGAHHLGATYEKGANSQTKTVDDVLNITKLKQLTPDVCWSPETVNHWAGVRAATLDYLPLVGPIADSAQFRRVFSGLESDSKRWAAQPAPCYPGLYACAGFGSRGLTTIPLSAEFLAGLINNEPSCLPRNMIQALSPMRFLRRDLIRGK
ncbi:MAG: bifunctional tRNA (5-methylaminomethyl-2-thiouridine)(34)-methyltransferase MnmD/FAD-dependent 5-carboxymethylaminomethyl-2-thiouridine(34) oxidoreductase MnmC [Legionellales bacterium]